MSKDRSAFERSKEIDGLIKAQMLKDARSLIQNRNIILTHSFEEAVAWVNQRMQRYQATVVPVTDRDSLARACYITARRLLWMQNYDDREVDSVHITCDDQFLDYWRCIAITSAYCDASNSWNLFTKQ